MAEGVGGWYSVAPDCVQSGVSPSEGVAKAYEECAGYFTFGPGRLWSEGDVVTSGSAGLYIITVLGFVVMIAAFVAWVWFENGKLTAQASKLRAAQSPTMGPPSPPESGVAAG